MHALIIEDEVLIAALIEDSLRAFGFSTFDWAVSEEQAVAFATARCPDLITADNRLSGGCGVSAVLTICERTPIPVLFVVADTADVLDVLPSAIVVCKPFERDSLRQAVGEALLTSQAEAPVFSQFATSSAGDHAARGVSPLLV